MKVKQALAIINSHAPYCLAQTWDNSGFLIGKGDTEITKILVALDFTEEVFSEAKELGCNLIVTHHPYIFRGVKQLTDDTPAGALTIRLIESGISLISAHTNLDMAHGGVNDTLCRVLGLEVIAQLGKISDGVGEIRAAVWNKPLSMLINNIKNTLGGSVRVSLSEEKTIKKVAVCSGSGCEFLETAAENGCDMLLTADAKYHDFQKAAELGIILLDAGHFETENIICPCIASMFGGIETIISKKHKGFYKTI